MNDDWLFLSNQLAACVGGTSRTVQTVTDHRAERFTHDFWKRQTKFRAKLAVEFTRHTLLDMKASNQVRLVGVVDKFNIRHRPYVCYIVRCFAKFNIRHRPYVCYIARCFADLDHPSHIFKDFCWRSSWSTTKHWSPIAYLCPTIGKRCQSYNKTSN